MSRLEKLIAKILKLSNDLRFDELKKVLELYGYVDNSPSSGSSHHTFRKKGKKSITMPNHDPMKVAYVKMVKEVIEGGKK